MREKKITLIRWSGNSPRKTEDDLYRLGVGRDVRSLVSGDKWPKRKNILSILSILKRYSSIEESRGMKMDDYSGPQWRFMTSREVEPEKTLALADDIGKDLSFRHSSPPPSSPFSFFFPSLDLCLSSLSSLSGLAFLSIPLVCDLQSPLVGISHSSTCLTSHLEKSLLQSPSILLSLSLFPFFSERHPTHLLMNYDPSSIS
jgi:hypothetical protein